MGMFGSRVRRILQFVVAAVVVLLPVAMQPATAAAASGTLYGISGTAAGQDVVTIDPISGAEIQLTDLTVPGAIDAQSSNLTADPATHRLFLIRTVVTGFDPTYGFPIFEFQVVTINALSGAITSSPAFSGMFAQSIKFDTASGSLFGITQTQVVKVDPATAAITPFASIPNPYGVYVYSMAVDSASHTLYLSQEDVSGSVETNSTRIYSVNTLVSGSISTGVVTDNAVRQIGVDGALLYGITECCAHNLVGIDKSSGVTSQIAQVGDSSTIVGFGTAADPTTNTIFVSIETNDPVTGAFNNELLDIDVSSPGVSTTAPLTAGFTDDGLVFVPPAPIITPQSIANDVNAALAGGKITNAGVARSLLAELSAAANARLRGQCTTAANDYQAFIKDVQAQSGKLIEAATANQLISEARILIASCP